MTAKDEKKVTPAADAAKVASPAPAVGEAAKTVDVPAGVAGDAGNSPAVAKTRNAPATVLGVNTTLEMPTSGNKRGNKPKYNFDTLEVGQSIGVIGRKAASMASTVSQAIRNFRVPKRDSEGNAVMKTDKDGNNVIEMENTRHFFVVDTDPATDPEKAECRIWRDK